MGCEMNDLCKECLDADRAYAKSDEARTGKCDWCKKDVTDLRTARDYEEGTHGPVYEICGACHKKQQDEINEELRQHDHDFPWDDGDCDLDD